MTNHEFTHLFQTFTEDNQLPPSKKKHLTISFRPSHEVPNNQDGPGEGVNLINIEAIPSGRGKPHPRNGGKPRGVKRREAFTAVRLKQRLETDIFQKNMLGKNAEKHRRFFFSKGEKGILLHIFGGANFSQVVPGFQRWVIALAKWSSINFKK